MSQLALDLAQLEGFEAPGALMQQVLDRIVTTYDNAGVDLPGRRYLNVGMTAHDCEQLTVSFIQMYAGSPGIRADAPQKCNSPRTLVLSVQLVRRVALPKGRTAPPDPDEISELTLLKAQDAWLLMDATLGLSDEYLGALADVSVTNPQGEYQAVVLSLSCGVP